MVWLKCWHFTSVSCKSRQLNTRGKLRNHQVAVFSTHDVLSPKDRNIFLDSMNLEPFPLFLFQSKRRPPVLQSCNFRAYKYLTGNDCGEPRKWHALSKTFAIYICTHLDSGFALLPSNLLLLAVGKCAFLAWWPFRWLLSQQTGEQLTCWLLPLLSKFPSLQSNTCLAFALLD